MYSVGEVWFGLVWKTDIMSNTHNTRNNHKIQRTSQKKKKRIDIKNMQGTPVGIKKIAEN